MIRPEAEREAKKLRSRARIVSKSAVGRRKHRGPGGEWPGDSDGRHTETKAGLIEEGREGGENPDSRLGECGCSSLGKAWVG